MLVMCMLQLGSNNCADQRVQNKITLKIVSGAMMTKVTALALPHRDSCRSRVSLELSMGRSVV